MEQSSRHRIASWLFVCAALVWATLLVGGVTRLTGSGLSIADWQPLVGALPPLDAESWHAVFARYRETPEYLLVNAGMSLDDFKHIFWWEYVHRLLGRSIGLAFALPFGYFAWRGDIDRTMKRRLLGLFLLGCAQGALGWYMVKSGLVDDPRVSQYRLAAHLALAFGIFGALVWTGLDMLRPRERGSRDAASARLCRNGALLLAGVFVMAISGGFVAGTHAGSVFNTFPLMNGNLVPPEILTLDPWYLNFFTNPAAVQFDHRAGAWLLACLIPWFVGRVWWGAGATPRTRGTAALVLALLVLQVSLGIATLLFFVPVALAVAHQCAAMLLFGALVWLNHELRAASVERADGVPCCA